MLQQVLYIQKKGEAFRFTQILNLLTDYFPFDINVTKLYKIICFF